MDSDDAPSIIEEVIIYNKPNLTTDALSIGKKIINIQSDVVISYATTRNMKSESNPPNNANLINKLKTEIRRSCNYKQDVEQKEEIDQDEMERIESEAITTNIKVEEDDADMGETIQMEQKCISTRATQQGTNADLLINYIKEKEQEIANNSDALSIRTRKSNRILNANKGKNDELQPVQRTPLKRKVNETIKPRKPAMNATIKSEKIESADENIQSEDADELKKSKINCKFCLNTFSSYYAMRKHRIREHSDQIHNQTVDGSKVLEENIPRKNEIDNNYDDNDLSDAESLGEWMPDDYAQYKIKHKMDKLNKRQGHKCKICCVVFPTYYKLSKHRLQHENTPSPYECSECDQSFKDIEEFTSHIRVHRGKDPYQCKKCIKGFSQKEELDKHALTHLFKKKPESIKRYRCDICFKEFVKLCDIERHSRVHTGEKPCECKICHKKFQQSHNLSKHLLIHLHVKPFQCVICNKKFGRIDVLNRHLLTHSMEKPFKCDNCNKGFIRQVQLTHHLTKCKSLDNNC